MTDPNENTPPPDATLPEATLIERPNTLLIKTGGPLPAALAGKAEQAAATVERDLGGEMGRLLEQVSALRQDYPASAKEMLRLALELKSLGSSAGFPLLTRIAHSLCRPLLDPAGAGNIPPALLEAHLDALRAILRDDIRSEDHPVALVLATELENQVAQRLTTRLTAKS